MTTTTGTWYPPALGTGGFLIEGQLFTNPPFAAMNEHDPTGRGQHEPGAKLDALKPRPALVLGGFSPTTDRQDAIETACHNAIRAMHDEAHTACRENRSPEACLILAGALTQLLMEGITGEEISDCITHLTRQAAPRRRPE